MTETIFLGIESSCDDTAAAVVTGDRRILSSVVSSQSDLHADFGGVVPEIAARAHAERLDLVVEQALADAGLGLDALTGVAVTAGPGPDRRRDGGRDVRQGHRRGHRPAAGGSEPPGGPTP